MTTTMDLAPGYALPDGMVAQWRSNGRVADVTKRVITVIAVPYDEDTEVTEGDRTYTERFARGAFNGVQARTGRIAVNRDHDLRRLVGKVHALHPTRPEGLIAELRMTPGVPLADETLEFARDDVLGASISFGVKADGVVWSDRGRHRLIKTAYLDHIALTPEPAYAGATVLDVRHRASAGPVADSAPRLTEALAVLAARELRSRFDIHD